MIAAWMLWALFLGSMLALAARAVEGALEAWRLPRRGVWLAASLLTLAGSAAGLRRIAGRAGEPGTGVALPWPAAPGSGGAVQSPPESGLSAEFGRALEPISGAIADAASVAPPDAVLIGAWAVLTALVAAAWLAGARRLRDLAASGTAGEVEGRPVRRTDGAGPAVAGVIRPAILWPRWADRLDRPSRRTMVLHEEEHVARRDPAVLAVGLATVALLPWNPVVWWQYRRLRRAVEIDCDRRVLRQLEGAGDYTSLLLDVAERRSLGVAALALVPPENQLEERIDAMISPSPKHPTLRGAAFGTAALALAVVACETPVPVQVHDEASPEGRAIQDASVRFDGGDGTFQLRSEEGEITRVRLEGDVAATRDAEGAITIRGPDGPPDRTRPMRVAIAEAEPLLVVDGEVLDRRGTASLEEIGVTPDRIDKIHVFKGPSAIERYGEAGVNGVIEIVTKR